MTVAASRTSQAASQAIYAALTSPPLTYVDGSGSATLAAANVHASAGWYLDKFPDMPAIAYSFSSEGVVSRATPYERRLRLTVWAISARDRDDVVEIYEAVRARLNFADQDAPYGFTDLSRPYASANQLRVAFRDLRETRASDPTYEATSDRWYVMAEFAAVAV